MSDYIPIRADVLVLVIGVSFYLIDLAQLLYANEVLLVRGSHSKWFAITPIDGIRFNRRHAVFPRFYDPGSVVIRFVWPTGELDNSSQQLDSINDIDARIKTLAVPRIICTLLLPEIFVGIPVAYLLPNNTWPILGLILLIYIQIIALVIWLLFSRRELQLPWKTTALLVFESLVCIPYAINFHRKVAERTIGLSGTDLLETSKCLLAGDRLNELRDHIRIAEDDRLDVERMEK